MNLSSSGHRFSDVDLDDPELRAHALRRFVAYGRSKTANVLFAVEFDRRHKARGVRATAVHPGGIQTELGRHMTPEVREKLIERSTPATQQRRAALRVEDDPARRGDLCLGRLRRRRRRVGGRYCEDCHVAELRRARTYGGACGPTRSIPRAPRLSGRRAKRWLASDLELTRTDPVIAAR